MRGAISTFWGKLAGDGPTREWHPLLDHCADVAACCEALLSQTSLGERLAALGGADALDEVQVARLGVLAAFHDLGKYNSGFQRKAEGDTATCGHVREILALFGEGYEDVQGQLCRVLPVDALGRWGADDAAFKLMVAAIGHHGRPYACGPPPKFSRFVWSAGRHGDPFDGIAELVAATRRWFPAAFEADGAGLPTGPHFQHGFAGLVMLADWLGSHVGIFEYTRELGVDRMPFARARARRALQQIGLDMAEPRRALGRRRPGFSSISRHPTPQPAQETTGGLPLERGGSLTILEAETGSGKTEAALLRYVQLFQAGLVDGLYFALPTRTAATQIHQRVLEAVALAFPECEPPPVVLAVPGYLRVDDRDGRRLPGFEVLWNDDHRQRYRYRGWAAENSKRYLAGAIVVGTIDQVLLSTIMVSHAHLRATAATRQLLVIDEVHASDAYMNRLLEEVLGFHLRAGGHAFLMSATLGASARARLLTAIGSEGACPGIEEASRLPYPMITHARPGTASSFVGVERGPRIRRIVPRVLPIADDPIAVARHALEAAARGARVLVVRNLVRDCVATQEAIEALAAATEAASLLFRARDVVAPHHSRFAREDRRILDEAVERAFGKDRPIGVGCVLVATQTVEQSLDLDADLLITDLCPMDVLLQRVGRLHRHERARPRGFEDATVDVVVAEERGLDRYLRPDGQAMGPHGYGTVYDDLRVLEATWRLCEASEVFEIPDDNRRLVEATTHPDALAAIADALGWGSHGERVRGRQIIDRQIAAHVLVDRSVPFGEARFLDKEEIGKIASRLGEDDRAITFTSPLVSPFGATISGLVLPHHMLRGAPEDPLAPVVASTDGDAVVFRYGDADYRYDRLGLRPAPRLAQIDREGEELQ